VTPSYVYVVGGKARETKEPLEEWEAFEEARVLRVDCETGEAECVIRYTSPPDRCPDHSPSMVFKAGARRGDTLFLCTQTEVLEYDLRSYEMKNLISLPSFNDVHHVHPMANGHLAVVVTGLDLVLEITREGEVVREWPVLDEAPFARFSRDIDYRKVSTTKPHLAHPNYAFEVDGHLWVTRFHQRDAIRLDDPTDRFSISHEPPHDGHVLGDSVYFTEVRGSLIRLDAETRGEAGRDVFCIGEMMGSEAPLGWCRSIALSDEGRIAMVGFTRLRKTKIQRNVNWVKEHVRRGFRFRWPGLKLVTAGTMIMMLDLEHRRVLRHIDLEPFGLDAIFSIHGEPGAASRC